LREKEAECDKITQYSIDIEGRYQKLIGDFQMFRNKAQQMLSQKDEELDKLKGRKNAATPGGLLADSAIYSH
jgi:SMC interacting uncharacterized protein involved in chromosome segregation